MKRVGGFIFTEDPPVGITPTWEIREGDALERLRELPDGGVRLFLTSPPYRKKFAYGVTGECGLESTLDEYLEYLTAVAKEMRRCATPDANFFCVIGDTANGSGGAGGDYGKSGKVTFTPHCIRGPREAGVPLKAQLLVPERARIAFTDVEWVPRLRVVWNKEDARRGAIDRPSYSYEEVLIFSASPKHFWNREAVLTPFRQSSKTQLETPYTGSARRVRDDGIEDPSETKRRMIEGMRKRPGALLKAVWNIPSGNQPVITVNGETIAGIASFPLTLAEICVCLGSAPGDLVVDPFAGMGTTGLAAAKWGRNSLGIELSRRFAAAARQRMKDAGF